MVMTIAQARKRKNETVALPISTQVKGDADTRPAETRSSFYRAHRFNDTTKDKKRRMADRHTSVQATTSHLKLRHANTVRETARFPAFSWWRIARCFRSSTFCLG